MNILELNQMEAIQGGGDISAPIGGFCVAFGGAKLLGWLAFTNPIAAGVVTAVAVGCLVNAVAAHEDWW